MADAEKTAGKKVLFWVVWSIVSSTILFFLINSPIGLGLLLLAMGGGGPYLVIAFIVFIFSGGAIGSRSSSGGNGFALGVAFCLAPFAILLSFAVVSDYWSDPLLIQREEKRAEKIISKLPPIPINGLYVESISLKWALGALLVDRQFPFIEGDVVNDKWLLDLSKDEQFIATKSIGRKFYRLALGPSDSSDCFFLKNENENPTRGVRVQPETCLTLTFDNALLSDTRLHINLEGLKFRNVHLNKLFGDAYLEVFRNGDTTPIVSIPYWPRSYVKAPEDFSPSYNETSSWMYGSFPDLMRKLLPRTIKLAKDGKPFVLGWNLYRPENLTDDGRSAPRVIVRRAGEALEDRNGRDQESWGTAYQRAQATGHPVVIGRNLILLPKSHTIFRTGADSSDLYSTDCCAFTVDHPLYSHEITVVAELLTREKRLKLTIKPESTPEELDAGSCNFRAMNLRITDSELIATGKYMCRNSRSDTYEWVVSLDQLPDWIKS